MMMKWEKRLILLSLDTHTHTTKNVINQSGDDDDDPHKQKTPLLSLSVTNDLEFSVWLTHSFKHTLYLCKFCCSF